MKSLADRLFETFIRVYGGKEAFALKLKLSEMSPETIKGWSAVAREVRRMEREAKRSGRREMFRRVGLTPTREVMSSEAAAAIFKPWIVKRPDGGCQVLFPLTELDGLIAKITGQPKRRP